MRLTNLPVASYAPYVLGVDPSTTHGAALLPISQCTDVHRYYSYVGAGEPVGTVITPPDLVSVSHWTCTRINPVSTEALLIWAVNSQYDACWFGADGGTMFAGQITPAVFSEIANPDGTLALQTLVDGWHYAGYTYNFSIWGEYA